MVKHLVEFCVERDLPELFELFAEWYKFNPRMREREFFDWQFRDTPNKFGEGEYDFLILRDQSERIVGCLGFVGFEFRLGNRIDIGGWTHNWHADRQGEGGLVLLGRFMEMVPNRFLLRLNDKSASIARMLRIPILPTLPRFWAAIDADRVAELFALSDSADRAILQRSSECFWRNMAAPAAKRVSRLDSEDEFLFEHLGGVSNYVRRSGRYLNWRYIDIPKHAYRIVRTDKSVGVYRIETVMGAEASVIRILEWTFGPEEAAGALTTVMAEAASHEPVLVDFHCTYRTLGSLLAPFGFVPQSATKISMPDLFRPTYRSGGYAVAIDLPPHRTTRTIDFDSWYITIGDSDIDRVKL
jgi:hypothetical protein